MAEVKISNLPVATTVADTDQVVVVQGGATKRGNASLLKGATGPAGTNGTNGTDGTSVQLKGSVAAFANLPGGAAQGDLWVTLDTGNGWVSNGAGTWSDVGPIRGPVGATGATGSTGAQGTTGAAGTNGTDGTSGAKWLTGSTVPSAGTGVDGDFYLRTNGDYYGPKTAGAWGAVIASLKGAAGSAIPVGGTTGQVLTKASATDGNATWQTPAAGGGGASNISGNFTVPDQGVISWDIAANAAGWGMVYLAALGATPVSQFAFNTAGTPTAFLTLVGGCGVLTGVLTGTTGAAGKISISVANGKVYLENRMGWAVSITVFLSIAGTLV